MSNNIFNDRAAERLREMQCNSNNDIEAMRDAMGEAVCMLLTLSERSHAAERERAVAVSTNLATIRGWVNDLRD
jgi:hypothetical protein